MLRGWPVVAEIAELLASTVSFILSAPSFTEKEKGFGHLGSKIWLAVVGYSTCKKHVPACVCTQEHACLCGGGCVCLRLDRCVYVHVYRHVCLYLRVSSCVSVSVC